MFDKITKKISSPGVMIGAGALIVLLIEFFLAKTNLLQFIYAAGEPLTIDAPVTINGTYTISAPQFIDTANSAYFLDPAASGNSLLVAGSVGIGTLNPAQKLDVAGTVKATAFSGDGSALTGVGGVPANTVVFYNGTSCPTGWAELTGARGRTVVGLPSGGTNAGTVGTALTNLEDRTHTHTGPSHTHTGPSHTHTVYAASAIWGAAYNGGWSPAGVIATGVQGYYATNNPETGSAGTGATGAGGTGATGTAATSGIIPYIQLLVCQKS